MAKHFTREQLDQAMLDAVARKQSQAQVGTDGQAQQLGDPERLREAMLRRNERRERELP